MTMQEHILAALREQFERWEDLLASMSEAEITAPLAPSEWSVKDVIAHLCAWQQRSIARLAAALDDREPQFPQWPAGLDPESQAQPHQLNAWLYQTYRDQSWSQVHQTWRDGFLRFLDLGAALPEKDLLDAGRYPWLEGHPLAFVLVASYDHHQEHLDTLLDWRQRHREGRVNSA